MYLHRLARLSVLLPLLLVLPLGALGVVGTTREARADADAWRKKFGGNDPDDIYAAILKAAERKDLEAGVPLLESAIEAEFPHLAVACGQALRTMEFPGTDKDTIREVEVLLKKALKTKETHQQKNLARVLGMWGHPLVDEHLAYLSGSRRNGDVQAEALFMMGWLKPTAEEPFRLTIKALGKAVSSKSGEVRCAAASAAGRLGRKEFTDKLVSAARKPKDDYSGLYAIWALKKIGYTGGIGTFLHVLGSSPSKEAMQACLKGITDLANPRDIEELLKFTKSGKKEYRTAAAQALGRLAWRGYFGKPPVTGEEAPSSAIEVPEPVIDRLVAMIELEDDWETRHAVRTALIRIGTPAKAKIQAHLPTAVDFTDDDVRRVSIELCGLFGAKDAFASIYKTSIFDKSFVMRMFAARALEGIDPEKAARDLRALALGAKGKKARDYELHAVSALGYIRHQAALEALLTLLESDVENEVILREAEFALERLTGHRFGRLAKRWRGWLKTAQHPLHPMIKKYDRSQNRREAVDKGLYGLTEETERCVERGLRWLELRQRSRGYWDGNEQGLGGYVNCMPAYTGLGMLAFLGAGYTPLGGKYAEIIRRGTEFLAATQFSDGSYPVTGGGDSSWIFAYVISMGVWGVAEGYALSGDPDLAEPAQWGIDYLVRVQTPGAGWYYSLRASRSDTSVTSWVLMTLKTGGLVGLDIAQSSIDGIDSWLQRCATDITGFEERIDDLSTDYDYEVGARQHYKMFTSYFPLGEKDKSGLRTGSMSAVGMVCRFFMGWKRSHPFIIGSANFISDYLPVWMSGLDRVQKPALYHYYWYYGTLAMHQMGGKYWRRWNEKIRRMYPEKQRKSPPELYGSWDPGTARMTGGRLFSTAMSILALETYYRFSPLLGEVEKAEDEEDGDGD